MTTQVTIRQASNGYIVDSAGSEHVFSGYGEMERWLQDRFGVIRKGVVAAVGPGAPSAQTAKGVGPYNLPEPPEALPRGMSPSVFKFWREAWKNSGPCALIEVPNGVDIDQAVIQIHQFKQTGIVI